MSNISLERKKKRFSIPHTFVILFFLVVIIAILTYIVPAGQFDRITDPNTGVVKVDANSYHKVDQSPVSFLGIFLSIQKGFVNAGSVIFLIFFAYFWVFSILKTGAFYGMINKMLIKIKGNDKYVIPVFMIVFGLAGSTYGEWDTIYGLIPIFVGLAMALGYDALVGLSMSGMAVAIGFASATTNPFTIGIAQSIAELPIFSGLLYRWVIFAVFMSIGIWWTMAYAKKVKANPECSLVRNVDFGSLVINEEELSKSEFNIKHKVIITSLFVTIGIIVYGSLKLGWYIDEMSAIFLLSGISISIYWGFNANEIANNFIEACSGIIIGAMVVGLSRAILIVLQDSNIIDTIIYAMYLPLKNLPSWAAAEGMLIVQNIINFFIPSGSGQATAIMPIMVPLSDLAGVNRQVAVLAYQFGDGYSNLFWPTCGIVIMASIAKIPLEKWYKYFAPLFGIMFLVESFFVILSVLINYGPF